MSYLDVLKILSTEISEFRAGRRSLGKLVYQVEAIVANYPNQSGIQDLDDLSGQLEIINARVLDPKSGKSIDDFSAEISKLLALIDAFIESKLGQSRRPSLKAR